MPEFKVGDAVRVRVGAGSLCPAGTTFVVTDLRESNTIRPHEYYVLGDPHGYGVWERDLERIAPPAPGPELVESVAYKLGYYDGLHMKAFVPEHHTREEFADFLAGYLAGYGEI